MTARGLLLSFLLLCAVSAPAADSLAIRFSRNVIDFGVVRDCGDVVDTFAIVNEGTAVAGTPAGRFVNGFEITPERPDNIMPGESRIMFVRFIGTTSGSPYSTLATFTFLGQGQSDLDTIRLRASRSNAPCLHFVIDDISARPGERANLVLRQDSVPPGVDLSSVYAVVTIVYDPSVFIPDSVDGVRSRIKGQIIVEGSLLAQNGTLITVPGTVVLGRAERSAVRIRAYSLSDPAVRATVDDGTLTVEGVCAEQGGRSFDPLPPVARIMARGGEFELRAEVSVPSSTIVINDMTGREAARIDVPPIAAHGAMLIRPSVAPGPYLVTWQPLDITTPLFLAD
jgi:hypothetical protein